MVKYCLLIMWERNCSEKMDITIKTYLIVCPLVFLAGFVDSIGGGGGLISLPAYMFAGLPAHNAVATNKFTSSIGTSVATFRLCRTTHPKYYFAIPAIVLAFIGSHIGSRLSLLVPDDAFKVFLCLALPVIAFYVLRKKDLEERDGVEISLKKQIIILSVSSFIVGMYDGFYGPGTGTFLILIYTGFARMTLMEAATTTKIANLTSNISALIVFLMNGLVFMQLGIVASIFSIAGNYIGAGLVLKNGNRIVRIIILSVISLLFLKLILDFF